MAAAEPASALKASKLSYPGRTDRLAPTDDDDDLSDLGSKTFWEKHGFKVVLAGIAAGCFVAGLVLR